MQHLSTPLSPVRIDAAEAPPNVPAAPIRPAIPHPGDLAESVGLARLALDLGYPATAVGILAEVQRSLLAATR
jgi:hypothetical protein